MGEDLHEASGRTENAMCRGSDRREDRTARSLQLTASLISLCANHRCCCLLKVLQSSRVLRHQSNEMQGLVSDEWNQSQSTCLKQTKQTKYCATITCARVSKLNKILCSDTSVLTITTCVVLQLEKVNHLGVENQLFHMQSRQ